MWQYHTITANLKYRWIRNENTAQFFKKSHFHSVFYVCRSPISTRLLFTRRDPASCTKYDRGVLETVIPTPISDRQLLAISHTARLNNSFSAPAKLRCECHSWTHQQESKLNLNWKSSLIPYYLLLPRTEYAKEEASKGCTLSPAC